MGEEESPFELLLKFLGFTVLINTCYDKIPQMYNILHSGSSQGIVLTNVVLEVIGMDDEDSAFHLLLKFLGSTVLINSCYDKIPEVYNILHSGSSDGIEMSSVIVELIGYSGMLTYQYAMAFPFHTFMENVMMVSQDWILLAVIIVNRRYVSIALIPQIIIYFIVFTSIAMYWLPDIVMLIAVGMTTPILCWGKLNQLVHILIEKDPGQLSSITWFIVTYDTAVRMLTTAVITKDIPMFVNLTSSEVLNLSILLSIIYYNHKKSRRRRRSRNSR